ncbi:MAG: FliA/WhiG family RNA polymerase sigma factor [Gemmatimonadales bacterium]|nr:FliA/WhiG family RNA polymerase sigma factor [Gemmatimonadales bacterium]
MTSTRMEHQAGANLTEALWDRYRDHGDMEARAALLDRYLGLVHHVAREVAQRAPQMEVDDLVSAGTIGLVKALESFDRSRGLAFSTYAVRRIRGAILDDLRSRDWIPRSVRMKGRKLAAAMHELETRLGRQPDPREVATALGLELETYFQWKQQVEGGILVSFEGTGDPDGRNPLAVEETLADPDAPIPGEALQQREEFAALRDAIGLLPEKERTVLALYYYEEMNLRQIAEVLHVTESRVSQIRTQALRRLRERLTAKDEE